MARTESTMLTLGTQAPSFSLPDVSTGKIVTTGEPGENAAFLAIFLSPHCPFVKHVQNEVARLGEDYARKGVRIVAISANDAEAYPDDGPEKLKEFAANLGLTFPLLYDETQEVAKAYRAACTPDFFLFDGGQRLVYRGQLDDSRPKSDIPVTGQDLRAALDAVLAGRPVSTEQRASVGCNIKWKAGNEPDYSRPAEGA
jgi:peroxiredoxin